MSWAQETPFDWSSKVTDDQRERVKQAVLDNIEIHLRSQGIPDFSRQMAERFYDRIEFDKLEGSVHSVLHYLDSWERTARERFLEVEIPAWQNSLSAEVFFSTAGPHWPQIVGAGIDSLVLEYTNLRKEWMRLQVERLMREEWRRRVDQSFKGYLTAMSDVSGEALRAEYLLDMDVVLGSFRNGALSPHAGRERTRLTTKFETLFSDAMQALGNELNQELGAEFANFRGEAQRSMTSAAEAVAGNLPVREILARLPKEIDRKFIWRSSSLFGPELQKVDGKVDAWVERERVAGRASIQEIITGGIEQFRSDAEAAFRRALSIELTEVEEAFKQAVRTSVASWSLSADVKPLMEEVRDSLLPQFPALTDSAVRNLLQQVVDQNVTSSLASLSLTSRGLTRAQPTHAELSMEERGVSALVDALFDDISHQIDGAVSGIVARASQTSLAPVLETLNALKRDKSTSGSLHLVSTAVAVSESEWLGADEKISSAFEEMYRSSRSTLDALSLELSTNVQNSAEQRVRSVGNTLTGIANQKVADLKSEAEALVTRIVSSVEGRVPDVNQNSGDSGGLQVDESGLTQFRAGLDAALAPVVVRNNQEIATASEQIQKDIGTWFKVWERGVRAESVSKMETAVAAEKARAVLASDGIVSDWKTEFQGVLNAKVAEARREKRDEFLEFFLRGDLSESPSDLVVELMQISDREIAETLQAMSLLLRTLPEGSDQPEVSEGAGEESRSLAERITGVSGDSASKAQRVQEEIVRQIDELFEKNTSTLLSKVEEEIGKKKSSAEKVLRREIASRFDSLEGDLTTAVDNQVRLNEVEVRRVLDSTDSELENMMFSELQGEFQSFVEVKRKEKKRKRFLGYLGSQEKGSAILGLGEKGVAFSADGRSSFFSSEEFEASGGGETSFRAGEDGITKLSLRDHEGEGDSVIKVQTALYDTSGGSPVAYAATREAYLSYQKTGELSSDSPVGARGIEEKDGKYFYTADARVGGVAGALRRDEAVSLGQMEKEFAVLLTDMQRKIRSLRSGAAAASALSGVPGISFGRSKSFGFAFGGIGNQTAVALGVSLKVAGHLLFKSGVGYSLNYAEDGGAVMSTGLSWSW